jgi:hypothetical protein
MERLRSRFPSSLGFAAALVALAAAAAACGSKPPPPAPAPVVVAPAPRPPPPPPPPKCESLDEGCKATADTKLTVLTSGYAFVPPAGWTYAKESDAVVVETSNSILALTAYDVSDAKTAAANRATAMDTLLTKLGQLDKPAATFWAHSVGTVTAGDITVAVYVNDKAKRADKEVTLAAFDAPLPDKKTAVLAASFDPNDDTSDAANKVRDAVATLAPAQAKP